MVDDSCERFDVLVIGGGPAGLSAAVVLGRSRRRVLLATDGRPRNAPAEGAHNVFTRDGTPPAELIRIGREQLTPYDVTLREDRVTGAERTADGFRVVFVGGGRVEARKLLFATGMRDILPPIDGLADLWGRSAFHCPYCHGWEVTDTPLAVYERGDAAFAFAKKLLGWSRDLVLFTDGPPEMTSEKLDHLAALGVEIREEPVEGLLANPAGDLEAVVLEGGEKVPRHALFIHPRCELRSDLPVRLGCATTAEGRVETGEHGETSVPGVYVAGDAGGNPEMVIVAAASGNMAAASINEELLDEDFGEGTGA